MVRKSFCLLMLGSFLLVGAIVPTASGQLQPPIRYKLLEGSTLEVPVGGMYEIHPLAGTFYLVPDVAGPILDHYFASDFDAYGPDFTTVRGDGEYWIGGEQPPDHRMVLDTIINGTTLMHFDSGLVMATSLFPMIEIRLVEYPLPPDDPYYLNVIAVPLRQVWFSTEVSFHNPAGQEFSHGDVLSNGGAVICDNACLTRSLGIEPPAPDIGLDGLAPVEVDTPEWWEQWFSPEDDAFSETLGPLQHGDFLSEAGFIVATNQQLTQNFWPLTSEDVGLDAITWGWPCMDWYFSSEVDFFSQYMGQMVGHGDVLCARDGWIYMTNELLLRNFHPIHHLVTRGLDALYMWETGEIWFSLEEGFEDDEYGLISDGDLLSDAGYVVYRNLELVARFEPVEDLDNFGLDALHLAYWSKGDMNCDTRVNAGDIPPFVQALLDPPGYNDDYLYCDRYLADINGDNRVNAGDIPYFVDLLINP